MLVVASGKDEYPDVKTGVTWLAACVTQVFSSVHLIASSQKSPHLTLNRSWSNSPPGLTGSTINTPVNEPYPAHSVPDLLIRPTSAMGEGGGAQRQSQSQKAH